MKREVYITMDYYELEELVKKTYEIKNYSFIATEECGNDSTHSFNVERKSLRDFEQEYIDEMKSGNPITCSNYAILNDLCNKEVLEPGNYLIEVCW